MRIARYASGYVIVRRLIWSLRVPNEFADAGKPLAADAGRQCRRSRSGFSLQAAREPYVPYIHLLVDYHFGFTKRALIGAVVSLFAEKVPVWLVFALSGTVWLITLGLFAKLFRRTFGFGEAQMPLFVFMAGSPFFLKNFMHTLGHFDIYGCAFAICLLLIPARSVAFVLLRRRFSVVLILIHHIHLLMYVPTIAVIAVLRYYLVQGVTRQSAGIGIAAMLAVGLLFLITQFRGSLAVPEAEFVQYLQEPDDRSQRAPTC